MDPLRLLLVHDFRAGAPYYFFIKIFGTAAYLPNASHSRSFVAWLVEEKILWRLCPRALSREIVEGTIPPKNGAALSISPGTQQDPRYLPRQQDMPSLLKAVKEEPSDEIGDNFQAPHNFNSIRVKEDPENLLEKVSPAEKYLLHQNIRPQTTAAVVKEEPMEFDVIEQDYQRHFYPHLPQPQLDQQFRQHQIYTQHRNSFDLNVKAPPGSEDDMPHIFHGLYLSSQAKRKYLESEKDVYNEVPAKRRNLEVTKDKGKKRLLEEPTTPPQPSRNPSKLMKITNSKPSQQTRDHIQTQLVKSWGPSTSDHILAKIMALAVHNYIHSEVIQPQKIKLPMKFINQKLLEDTPLLQKLLDMRNALLDEMTNSPLRGLKWSQPPLAGLENHYLREFQGIFAQRETANGAYTPNYCKADMSQAIENIEAILTSASSRLGDFQYSTLVRGMTHRETAISPSHPGGSIYERISQDSVINGNVMSEQKKEARGWKINNYGDDFVNPQKKKKVLLDGKALRKAIAKSIILDGILSARIRLAFESTDHPEEQSIVYYSSVAGAITDIYIDSVELKEIVPPTQPFSAKDEAFRRVLVVFTHFLQPIFLVDGFGESIFTNVQLNLLEIRRAPTLPYKMNIIEHLEIMRKLFVDPSRGPWERLGVFKAGSSEIVSVIKTIEKEPPKGVERAKMIAELMQRRGRGDQNHPQPQLQPQPAASIGSNQAGETQMIPIRLPMPTSR
ncbi:hypothetical protein PGTUg99_024309 [Puccinia graminis f. sp. tritici]|uniref:Uncharacterized protein n=1 Tax=Puccinia graminis f. sp. tritici TaxID=56615 RepID=A0A5B0S1P8_PUCGR|nr:hypothetical protein PGTUg99_024309 [Puccinia graminis f. sp. tritici]